MGSFSVACGMSHIPITGGEKVLFLPIKQNKYLNNIPNEHFFCYATDLYEPALLPIEGTYNSYGTIENIVKNEHTQYLEEKFNNSIEIILSTITHKRNLFSKWHNDLASAWGLTIYGDNDLKTFFNLGFKLIEENDSSYMYLEKYKLSIFSTTSIFSISKSYIIKNNLIEKTFNPYTGTTLQEFILLNFKILLGLKDDKNNSNIVNLYNMGGQFFLKNIFDEMSSLSFSEYKIDKIKPTNSFYFSISEFHLFDLGFKKIGDSYFYEDLIEVKNLNRSFFEVKYKNKIKQFYNLNEFLTFFEKNNVLFDKTVLKKYSFFKTKLLELKTLLREREVDFESLNKLKEECILEGKDYSDIDKTIKISFYSIIERHIFGSNTSFLSDNYIDYFYNTAISFDINQDYFLLDYYSTFSKFRSAMVATNKLFIPSFCGYQDGATHVSKYLAQLTIRTINKG